jgi:hypothetical protein
MSTRSTVHIVEEEHEIIGSDIVSILQTIDTDSVQEIGEIGLALFVGLHALNTSGQITSPEAR